MLVKCKCVHTTVWYSTCQESCCLEIVWLSTCLNCHDSCICLQEEMIKKLLAKPFKMPKPNYAGKPHPHSTQWGPPGMKFLVSQALPTCPEVWEWDGLECGRLSTIPTRRERSSFTPLASSLPTSNSQSTCWSSSQNYMYSSVVRLWVVLRYTVLGKFEDHGPFVRYTSPPSR